VIQESQKTVTEKTISHQKGNPFLKDLEIFLTFHSPEYSLVSPVFSRKSLCDTPDRGLWMNVFILCDFL
jgi:hypothetical protein